MQAVASVHDSGGGEDFFDILIILSFLISFNSSNPSLLFTSHPETHLHLVLGLDMNTQSFGHRTAFQHLVLLLLSLGTT
jgi:hypothetical protein